jgi:Tol biopolymer transport system component
MTGGALALAGSVCFAALDARAATAEPLRLAATHLQLATESSQDGTMTLAITLTNTGSVAAEDMRLSLLAGPGLPVMPGENVLAAGGLAAGQTVTLSRPIRVRTLVGASRGGLPLMVIRAEGVAADGTTPVSTGVLSRAGDDPRARASSARSATEHLRRGSTERVSVDSAGNQANDFIFEPAISADGRFVGFYSGADNLVPGDTNDASDIFVHDRRTGLTERVSVDSAGNQGNSASFELPAISAHGRFVAFVSDASNLVPGDTDDTDVFVHDRKTGVTQLVSIDSAGNQGNGFSFAPAISAHGRFVAFDSSADNLVPGDTNDFHDVFVHDRRTGVTERVSVDSAGNQGNEGSGGPAISADGRFVAFNSFADNLVPGDTNGGSDVFVHDRRTGVTERVSVDSAIDFSSRPAISGHGRFVAFASDADNLVPGDTNDTSDVFVHDRKTGVTERVSVDSAGNQGNNFSFYSAISAHGRFVAFTSGAHVFVHDRKTRVTELVSVDSAGNQGNSVSDEPAISADGRFVAFRSFADNLVPGDTNDATDVFVHDRKRKIAETGGADLAGE